MCLILRPLDRCLSCCLAPRGQGLGCTLTRACEYLLLCLSSSFVTLIRVYHVEQPQRQSVVGHF